jgi:hypothetical protein
MRVNKICIEEKLIDLRNLSEGRVCAMTTFLNYIKEQTLQKNSFLTLLMGPNAALKVVGNEK